MFSEDGEEVEVNNFPFAIALKSRLKIEDFKRKVGGTFVDDLIQIPIGTILYEVFCIKDPKRMDEVEKIGFIKTVSVVMRSGGDSGIFFKHQKREEDFEIKSEWGEWRKGRGGDVGSSWFDKIIERDEDGTNETRRGMGKLNRNC